MVHLLHVQKEKVSFLSKIKIQVFTSKIKYKLKIENFLNLLPPNISNLSPNELKLLPVVHFNSKNILKNKKSFFFLHS